ncbi:MAG: chromate efflux transporter [Planctomycetota bacterium]
MPHQSLAALFLRFFRFGWLAWGGPVAQIAMIQRELVDEQHWISPARFRRALAVYQVLPGPEAHELCVYFGMVARGRIGALLAGLGFMLPGFVLMSVLSVLYAQNTLATNELRPVFVGLQAGVVALVVRALFHIGHHSLHDRWLLAIAAIACGASLLDVNFLVPLAFGGIAYLLLSRRSWWVAALLIALLVGWVGWIVVSGAPSGSGDGVPAPVLAPPSTWALFASGLRSGMLTFGGAYTVIPFLQHDAVVAGAWMTNDQFLDGVALGGVLPAPLIIFATFVGYIGGGWPGLLAMTAGIFLPAFCFTLLGHGLFERLTANKAVHGFLDGVTASVVGVMAATTVGLLRAGVSDLSTACIALAALAALWSWKGRAAVPIVVLASGLVGWMLCR